PPGAVRSARSHDGDVLADLAQITRDIGGASGVKRLTRHFDHGDRRFRRDAANLPPDEFVEHEVARDRKALARGEGQDFAKTLESHGQSRRRLTKLPGEATAEIGCCDSRRLDRIAICAAEWFC